MHSERDVPHVYWLHQPAQIFGVGAMGAATVAARFGGGCGYGGGYGGGGRAGLHAMPELHPRHCRLWHCGHMDATRSKVIKGCE